MAFIDVLKFHGPENTLVWKWEPEEHKWGRRNDELRLGSQLIVHPSFIAVFVNGGQIADIFAPGTYTLSTKNLPILDRLITLPLGGQSPFKAEVYYINKAVVMDTKFGIQSFNIPDPNFKVPIPMQCLGSFAIRIGEARLFMTKILGTLNVFSSDKISDYFRSLITEKVKSAIGKVTKEKKLIPLELETIGSDVAEDIFPIIKQTFSEYGIRLELFNIERISVIYDNPRVEELVGKYEKIMTEDLAERLRLKRRGENLDVYRVERSFDTTEAVANNVGQGSNGGDNGIAGTIIGMGMAQPIATAVGGVVQSALGHIQTGNPLSQNQQLQQTATTNNNELFEKLKELKALKAEGLLTDEEFAALKKRILPI